MIRDLRRTVRSYTEMARETRRWINLNPTKAAHWRAESARLAALAAAAEVDLQIAIHRRAIQAQHEPREL